MLVVDEAVSKDLAPGQTQSILLFLRIASEFDTTLLNWRTPVGGTHRWGDHTSKAWVHKVVRYAMKGLGAHGG